MTRKKRKAAPDVRWRRAPAFQEHHELLLRARRMVPYAHWRQDSLEVGVTHGAGAITPACELIGVRAEEMPAPEPGDTVHAFECWPCRSKRFGVEEPYGFNPC